MDTYLIFKFVHMLAVVGAFGGAALMHFNLARLGRAEQLSQARDAMGTVASLGPKMPLFAVALLLTGGYLANRWTWSVAWIQVGTAGLLSMMVLSVAVLKPKMAALGMRLAQAGDGPVGDDMRSAIRNPMLHAATFYQSFMATAIMFLMVVKPGMTVSLVSMAVVLVVTGMVGMKR